MTTKSPKKKTVGFEGHNHGRASPSEEEKREAVLLRELGFVDIRKTRPADPPLPDSDPRKQFESTYNLSLLDSDLELRNPTNRSY